MPQTPETRCASWYGAWGSETAILEHFPALFRYWTFHFSPKTCKMAHFRPLCCSEHRVSRRLLRDLVPFISRHHMAVRTDSLHSATVLLPDQNTAKLPQIGSQKASLADGNARPANRCTAGYLVCMHAGNSKQLCQRLGACPRRAWVLPLQGPKAEGGRGRDQGEILRY